MKTDAILKERLEAYTSKINLQRGKLTVENTKSRERKRICSEVSVNSPGNPWSQSRRNGRECRTFPLPDNSPTDKSRRRTSSLPEIIP